MFEKVYPIVTFGLILGGLAQAIIMPLAGALSALGILLALTVKFFLGKSQAALVAPAIQKSASSAAASAAKAASFWGLIIDYLTSPMDQFEKISLSLGWILLPIAASLPFVVVIGAIKDYCRENLLDICQYLPADLIMDFMK